MLALSDSQLALLCIGATRLPVHARRRWLRDVAAKLDPPTHPPPPESARRATSRQQRWRIRQRNGHRIFKVEAIEHDIINALIETA
jgi:hypothetical protein